MTSFFLWDNFSSNFIVYEIDKLFIENKSINLNGFLSVNSKSAQVFYDEEFSSNKRFDIKNSINQQNLDEY